MYPPIYIFAAADAGVTAQLGTSPTRLYPWGEAPQGVALPYAVWRIASGAPENHLGSRPDIDQFTVQVDVYARRGSEAVAAAEALRDVIENHAYIVRWGGQDTDPDTNNRHISFDASWFVSRAVFEGGVFAQGVYA